MAIKKAKRLLKEISLLGKEDRFPEELSGGKKTTYSYRCGVWMLLNWLVQLRVASM